MKNDLIMYIFFFLSNFNSSHFYKHAQKKKNITGVHLETKQMHWYISGSVSASLFQLKQLRVTF